MGNTADVFNDAAADERTSYSYDALGRRAEVKEYAFGNLARAVKYQYDPVTGQVGQVDSPEGTLHYEFDPATGRHTRTWTSSNDTEFGYDTLGRLQTVTSHRLNGQMLGDHNLTTYRYDELGALLSVALPNGVTTAYAYDGLNQLTLVNATRDDLNTGPVETVPVARFDYDSPLRNGTLSLQVDGQRGGVVETRYDNAGNATSTAVIDYEYDALNRLTQERHDRDDNGTYEESIAYNFDRAGNRHLKLVDRPAPAEDETVTYAYDANDRLLHEVSSNAAHDVDYGHDDNGSTTLKSAAGAAEPVTYTWDLRNRLTRATVGGNPAESEPPTLEANYGYDTDGTRVWKSRTADNATTTTVYHVDANNPTGYSQVLDEKPTTGTAAPTRSYVLGSDVIAQAELISGMPTTRHFLYDGHGSTRALLDTGGHVVTGTAYDYDAYGNAVGFSAAASSSLATNLLYSGEQWDADLGMQYLRARYYDADAGRLRSFDQYEASSGLPISLHKYLYANGDPVNGRDPSGHFAEFTLGGLLATSLIGLHLDYGAVRSPYQVGHRLGLRHSQPHAVFGSRAEHIFNVISEDFEYATAWISGFTEGAGQGCLNVLNGVTDAFVGIANLAVQANPATGFLTALGMEPPALAAPDWSYGLIYDENPTQHAISKFLGGQGAMALATLGIGAMISRGSEIHHVATVTHKTKWTGIFEEMFGEAGVSMEHAANKVRVAGHVGPHPDLYHRLIFNELSTATAGREGGAFTVALIRKLEELAVRCATPGDPLNYFITQP